MPSEAVVKSVSKKLKYYFQVKRLEDGFDLSGPDCPRLDHPPLKARPTLQYDGLHDRPLKHYFSPAEVRTMLTQFRAVEETSGSEQKVKKRVKKYVRSYDFKPSALPDTYYAKGKNGTRHTRHETMGYGIPLKKKARPIASYPVLRSTPNSLMTRGEANRLVNMATRLIVATDTLELKSDEDRKHEKNPYLHSKKQSDSLPSLDKSGSRQKSPRGPSCPRSFESKIIEYEYDINGRKVPVSKRSSEDDDKGYSSSHDGYVTISGKPADDRKVPPWLKKEMRYSKVKAKDGAQRPHSAAAPKAKSQRPPSGNRPKSAVVARPPSEKKKPKQPKPHRPADPSTLPVDVQPTAWDLEVCSTCADEAKAENPEPRQREPVSIQTSGELLKDYDPMERVIWDGEMCRYRVHVYTGNRLGASTKADVKLVLCGDKGRTEEFWLQGSKKHKIAFQKGQEDSFDVEQFYVGKLRKISIGHDRTELGYGWFLDKVVVKDMIRLIRYEIPCNRWLSSKEGDGLTVREFSVAMDTMFQEAEDSGSEYEEPVQTRKTPTPPPITYTRQAPSQDTASHTSLDMNRSRQGSGSRHSRPTSGHSSSTYSTDATSPYSTDSESTATSRSVSPASTPRAPQQPQVYVPAQKRHDDFFDQSVASEKDYTSVLDSLADREKDFPRTSQNDSTQESRPRSGELSLKPVPRTDTVKNTEQHVTFTQDKKKPVERTPPIYEDSDSETARLSVGAQSDRSENQHQFMDGFKAGLEAAKKSHDAETPQSPKHSRSDSDTSVTAGLSVHEAAKCGDLNRIKQLVKHNAAQKTLEDERGWCPLHLSAKHGQVDVVQWLSVNLTDLDVLTPTGYTAIHIAAMNGHTDCIKVLSAMGAQLDCKNTDDQTPLHLAAMSGFIDTVKWLVANNADINARDNSGNTPLDRARTYEHTDVVEYLETCEKELANPNSQYSMTRNRTDSTSSATSNTSRTRTTSSSSSSSSSGSSATLNSTAHVHAHAHTAVAESGRPKTSRGERGGRDGQGDTRKSAEKDGYSSDKENGHDQELMINTGPSFLDSIRAEYEKS